MRAEDSGEKFQHQHHPSLGRPGGKTSSGTGTSPTSAPAAGPTSTPTPGAVVAAPVIPLTTTTVTPAATYRLPPPVVNSTANYTVIYDQSLPFTWNSSAVTYELTNPPLLIDYTLTVPNITRVKYGVDPVSGADTTVTATYPDPDARFEITVLDPVTKRIFAQNGFGGQYDVSYSKELRVLYPGKYQIQMSGNKVTAEIKFTVPPGNLGT